MPPIDRIALAVLLTAGVAACASVQVRSVATNTGQAAYDLSGSDIASLAAEAGRLCPQGHVVLHQWQRSNRQVASDAPPNWFLSNGVLSYDIQPDAAQMSIACKL